MAQNLEIKAIKLNSIGNARVDESKGIYSIEILPKFRPGLKELENFSHVHVIWWANLHDNQKSRKILQIAKLPAFYGSKAPTMGVFATRSEYRPNPLALSSLEIKSLNLKKGVISFAYFDAFDNTPILDLKPYLPMTDRIMSARYPPYLQHWPANNEEAAAWWAEQRMESPE